MSDWTVGTTGLRSYEDYVSASRGPNQELGKNEFLSLLAAQMQYQDPLEPTKDTAFVAQLAQFTSLEQLTNLNTTMSTYQYFGLTGQYVNAAGVAFSDGTTQDVFGLVDRVIIKDGTAYVQIGDNVVKASAITQVYDKDLVSGTNPLLAPAALIGRTVTANVEPAEGETEGRQVTGVLTRVSVNADNGLVGYVTDDSGKEHQVMVSNIVDIKQ